MQIAFHTGSRLLDIKEGAEGVQSVVFVRGDAPTRKGVSSNHRIVIQSKPTHGLFTTCSDAKSNFFSSVVAVPAERAPYNHPLPFVIIVFNQHFLHDRNNNNNSDLLLISVKSLHVYHNVRRRAASPPLS